MPGKSGRAKVGMQTAEKFHAVPIGVHYGINFHTYNFLKMQVEYTLNVQSGSAYAHLNGCNFPAVEQCGERITLLINGVSTDFNIKEVKIHHIENGTWYNAETPYQVIQILEQCRASRTRIILDYGDTQDGKSWGELHDVCGYVGRSTGGKKIPILVYNRRSYGGGAILTHAIVRIMTSKGKRVLYQHPTYFQVCDY